MWNSYLKSLQLAMADSTYETLSTWFPILCSFYYDVLYPQELTVNQGLILIISMSLSPSPLAPKYII